MILPACQHAALSLTLPPLARQLDTVSGHRRSAAQPSRDMDPDTPTAHDSAETPVEDVKSTPADDHERDVEDREAHEAWGYLFKPDKTGTDKFKALLRGVKDMIVCLRHPWNAHI